MKKILLTLLIAFISISGFSQIQNPIKWSYSVENNGKENASLVIKAKIDKKWHLYSQFVGDGGPVPTTIKFKPSKEYSLVGKTSESPKPHSNYEELFGMQVAYFEDMYCH